MVLCSPSLTQINKKNLTGQQTVRVFFPPHKREIPTEINTRGLAYKRSENSKVKKKVQRAH